MIEQAEVRPADGMSSEAQAESRKPTILIVDDSLTVRMDLRETFESAGFATTCCETLASAKDALALNVFSLVILDVLLPDGDGVDLLREIKSGSRTPIPVLMLSTEAEVRDRVRGLKTGADDYIGKPYDGTYVLARARELTRGQAPGGPDRDNLLLIDDSATFREEFKSSLEAAGYRVVTAESGEEGLKTAFGIRPQLIIVDRVLGEGMNGDAVVRRLKQDITLRNTPCLLLTASTESGEELRALEGGADAYLTKDTDNQVILARIHALLRRQRPSCGVDSPTSSLLGSKKILAVDDSMTFLNEVSTQLREEGYDVIPAASGKEALELLAVQTVDCILLDVRMPELSGNETCRIVKKRPELRNIPLLMLTAAEEPEAVIEGMNAGADDYVCKSSDFAVLKARVRAQLRRKQFEDEYRGIREELHRKTLETTQARAAQEIAEARAAMVDELEKKNRELEAFAYSASHDLRAPLRTVRGFSQALLDDFAGQLPPGATQHVRRVQTAAERMGRLIDALLEMSRTSRAVLNREVCDLTKLAQSLAAELAESDQARQVEWIVSEGLVTSADVALTRVVLNNLLSNAWKFTGETQHARIEMGALPEADPTVYFVRDNGVGFDRGKAKRLFQPFERLHPAAQFPGAGIGLSTVRRIIERHGGTLWADSEVGKGASFFFTLSAPSRSSQTTV